MAISSVKHDTSAWLTANDGSVVKSNKTLKLLGFMFGEKPTVNAQVDNIKMRANIRIAVIRCYSGFMEGSKLIKLYSSLVRSVIEYSSSSDNSMLTKYQSNELEKLQNCCLKMMFGYTKNYTKLLSLSGPETLLSRRISTVRKFAEKSQCRNFCNPRFFGILGAWLSDKLMYPKYLKSDIIEKKWDVADLKPDQCPKMLAVDWPITLSR